MLSEDELKALVEKWDKAIEYYEECREWAFKQLDQIKEDKGEM